MQRLREADRKKDKFLALLSHELRIPLTPILSGIEVLERHADLPFEVQNAIQVIKRNVQLEAKLLHDLLDLAKAIHGKLTLQKQHIDIYEVVRQAVATCFDEMQKKGIQFFLQLSGATCVVHGDFLRLQQVFWNLIRNAVKFTPSYGSVSVTGTVIDGEVQIEVSDTGIGIEPLVLEKIFNPFDQGERRDGESFGGLGLGLAISKSLVEEHDGTISAASDGQGFGASFTVRLPLALEKRTNSIVVNEHHALSNSFVLKILVVEDHIDTAEMLKLLLEMDGHVVALAYTGESALEILGEDKFDVLISDLGLPDMDGCELASNALKISPSIYSIALSGYGTERDKKRSAESGFHAHILKPLDFEELKVVLQKATESL